jgi:hypothetical protein
MAKPIDINPLIHKKVPLLWRGGGAFLASRGGLANFKKENNFFVLFYFITWLNHPGIFTHNTGSVKMPPLHRRGTI